MKKDYQSTPFIFQMQIGGQNQSKETAQNRRKIYSLEQKVKELKK